MPSQPSRRRPNKCRYWVFTENDEPEAFIESLNQEWPLPGLSFVQGQLESAPVTGQLHFQGVVGCAKQVRLSQLKKLLSPTAHFEPMKGRIDQAIDYCSKDASRVDGPFSWGDVPQKTQGKRNDLLAVQAHIADGASYEEIAESNFCEWVKYRNAFAEYIGIQKRSKSLRGKIPCHVEVHWGVPGSGKSTAVSEKYPDAYHYSYNKGCWWPGYNGQDVVIIEEMQGFYFQFSYLCLLLDIHPFSVENKGGFFPMCATKFIFTSNTDPQDWYIRAKVNYGALDRRITEIYYYPFKYPYAPGNEPFQTRFPVVQSPPHSPDSDYEFTRNNSEKVPNSPDANEVYAMSRTAQ